MNKLKLTFLIIILFSNGCATIEPMVKNKYNLVQNVNLNKIELIERVAILAEISNWKEKDVLTGVYNKSNEAREQARLVAEVTFKGAIKKILNLKGYECVYIEGNLNHAYEKAQNEGCQALLYAKFKWTKSRLYYDQENWGTYTKIWYAEDVPMANGYFDIKDIRTKGSIFKIEYSGHSDVSGGRKPFERHLLGQETLKGEKEIPYIYRIVEESLKEFPTIDKLVK